MQFFRLSAFITLESCPSLREKNIVVQCGVFRLPYYYDSRGKGQCHEIFVYMGFFLHTMQEKTHVKPMQCIGFHQASDNHVSPILIFLIHGDTSARG